MCKFWSDYIIYCLFETVISWFWGVKLFLRGLGTPAVRNSHSDTPLFESPETVEKIIRQQLDMPSLFLCEIRWKIPWYAQCPHLRITPQSLSLWTSLVFLAFACLLSLTWCNTLWYHICYVAVGWQGKVRGQVMESQMPDMQVWRDVVFSTNMVFDPEPTTWTVESWCRWFGEISNCVGPENPNWYWKTKRHPGNQQWPAWCLVNLVPKVSHNKYFQHRGKW